MAPLILASGSRYRQQQFRALGIDVQCIAPDIDETPFPDECPAALCQRLADAKAHKIATQHPDALVIGSDQVALIEGSEPAQVLGKPHTHENAVNQLKMCSGAAVSFYTAVSLHCQSQNIRTTQMEPTRVIFRALSDTDIERYLLCEKPYDCAGSFKSEGRGVLLFERIETRDPNALIGLPVMLVRDMLASHAGVDLLALATAQATG
ncbi:Maf family protein [Alteromonas halophila]|uniref:7-methyl-GTP pyrophosphatase n=1 Tax=Alteromonas halophila TaxID=516698 RepID=A0A918JG10_9ALTE|nr:nucleoside triphosphate pyrophosphatase [Alteromonas halophila]GGW76813.1 Maf-like protein [Alteromonas halophila]